MAKQRVVIDVDFGIQGYQTIILCNNQGIDLHQGAVLGDEQLVEFTHQLLELLDDSGR